MRQPSERYLHLYDRGYDADAIAALYEIDAETVREALAPLNISYAPGEKPKRRKRSPIWDGPAPKRERCDWREKAQGLIAFAEPPRPERSWCAQCDRPVYPNEAAACQSRFCKAKALAA